MELIARLAIEVDHSLVHAVAFSEEVEGDIGRDQPAANQEHDLDHIRQRHRLQSSVYRIDTGKGRQPDGIAGAGHADKLFGGDIGSDDGSAYRPPGKPAPGEEIIAGIPLVPLLAA